MVTEHQMRAIARLMALLIGAGALYGIGIVAAITLGFFGNVTLGRYALIVL